MTELKRRFPVRFTAQMVGLGFVVIEGVARHFEAGVGDEVLMAALALIGGGVYGDTVRPSGMTAPSTTTVDIATPG